ncbi:unnamed protein product [Coregonus sp. 'balchen']|nr:unnamed protein product [Coregonus sp. 'balchen']
MAARGHVQDPNDRRLRPIYDYLDNGNNKMAIQQADKLLKKHKDLHCAKVLKAIGLQRTGKQDEAFSLAQELVTKLYEAAVKKVPLSEEYHSHLFMAYARVGEYKKMQQMVKEEKIEAEAEVQLYFMILERLGKCVEALDVVRGPLGEKLTSELQSRENKCMMMYQRLQLWPECNALSYKLLLKNPDDWQFYLSYFDSLFHLMDKSWSLPKEEEYCVEGPVQTTVAEAVKFVVDRMEEQDKKESRDPLELMFKNRLGELVPLGEVGEDGFGFPGDTKALQRHLCVCQLSRALGLQHALDTEGKLRLITELKAHYHHGLQFGKSCLKTELQFSDIPSNAQFKLLLLLLFCRLGAFQPVVDLYSSLDAKHVQHDTIGYLLTRYAGSLGQFAAASQSCNFSLRFFHSNQKDTSEYIIQAYKYGAFEKIPEFIAFRTRLNQSLHFAQVRTERMLLDLYTEADIASSLEESVKAMGVCPEEDDIPWDNMRDNRDLTEESVWLKVRSLTLRLLASLALLGHAPSSRNSDKTNENGASALQLALTLQELETTGLDDSSELQTQICNSFKSLIVQLEEMLSRCKGEVLEMKDSRLKTQPSLLETLVFFVETVCVVLWVTSYSASVLRPLKSSLQKKKKKRKDTSTAMPVVLCGFQEWTGSLQGVVTQALDHVKGQEASLTALKLAALTLEEGHAQTQEECGFTRAAMDKVQKPQDLTHHHPSINIVIPNYHYYTGSPHHLTPPPHSAVSPCSSQRRSACHQHTISFTSSLSLSTYPSLWVSLYITGLYPSLPFFISHRENHHCSLSKEPQIFPVYYM